MFLRRRKQTDLNAEIEAHLQLEAERLKDLGMSEDEARLAARRVFGNVTLRQEHFYESGRWLWWDHLVQDVRYGVRMLRKSPGFAVVAIFTLALGIGANSAIFTVVDTVLLHSLPYPDSDRIVNVFRKDGAGDSIPMFVFWQHNNPGFEELAGYAGGATAINMTGDDRTDLIQALRVSRNFFRLFGANSVLGRTFTADEDVPGGPQTLVMSYGLWQRRFGGDPSILGKAIDLGGAPYRVIGVLSPGFKSYPSTDVWIPLQADTKSTDQAHLFMVSSRLPKDLPLGKANSEMAVVGKRYMQTHPEDLGNDGNLQVVPMQQQMTGDVRAALLILLGAVAMVLLIACANVANLLLARATGRQKEIAVRAAMGAGWARIVRQVLVESVLLAFLGGALGLALASCGMRALLELAPGDLPRVQEMASVPALNPWVAGFTVLLSGLTGVLFGLLPAAQLARTDLASSLTQGGRTGTGLKQNRTRSTLVAAEVAIAVVLLCGAVLLIRSFAALHKVDPGFDPHNLLTVTVSLDGPKYSNTGDVDRLARHLMERLEHIPGVETAAMTSGLPLGQNMDMIFDIPGRPPLKGYQFTGDVLWPFVSPHYFETLRIPLLAGRLLQEYEPARTVVINQALADRFWPHQNPVGQTILIGAHLGPQFDQGPVQIVGVVGNVRDRLDWPPPPTMYQTHSQVPDAAMKLVNGQMPGGILVRTRTGVEPLGVSSQVRQLLLNMQLPAAKVRTMEQAMFDSTARANFDLLLLSTFGGMALLLAGLGIFGVVSYTVRLRNRELGIRMALGAQRGDVLRLVVRQGMIPALLGLGTGVIGALGLTRFISSLLYGVKTADPVTFVIVGLVFAAVALVACYLPALRATKVDPMVVLR